MAPVRRMSACSVYELDRQNLVGAVQVDDLVARSHEGDARRVVHQRRRVGDRCQDAELSRAKRRAGAEHDGIFADVLSAIPHVLACITSSDHGDVPARRVGFGILLANDGIGASRQRCAGEDARHLSGADRLRGEAASGDRLDDLEGDLALGACGLDVRCSCRVAVHC